MSFLPISPELLADMSQPSVKLAFLAEFDFASAPAYMHSGLGSLQHNGNTYIGLGNLVDVGGLNQDGTTGAKSISLSLSGLNDELLAIALAEGIVGVNVRLALASLNDDRTIKHSGMLFQGFITSQAVSRGDDNTINVEVGGRFARFKQGVPWRNTNENHIARNPGDCFFHHVSQTANAEMRWGSTVTAERFRYT